jgi:hypothetical protein
VLINIQVLFFSNLIVFFFILDCDHDYTNLDDSVWDDSDEVFNDAAELDREWQRRRDQFHTVIYN